MVKIKDRYGFTLVEIMIVIGIIALLTVIALPNLIRTRHNANETAAIEALRIISVACKSYRLSKIPQAYPGSLKDLVPYIDKDLAAATNASKAIQGYYYEYDYDLDNPDQFTCYARPKESGISGTRIFFINEEGVVRLNDAGGAPIE